MTTAADLMVRMGDLAVTTVPGQVLVSIGLGSCIGLILIDRRRSVAGLAHVMLPAGDDAGAPGKFASTAVPALTERMKQAGALPSALEAVLVGGAQMFDSAGGRSLLDVGARNDEATRAALARASIPVCAEATAGNRGRTVRVCVDGPRVTVKEAGAEERPLYPPESRS